MEYIFLIFSFVVFVALSDSIFWNPWSKIYQRNFTNIPIDSDEKCLYMGSEIAGQKIDPSLQIYFIGLFPYSSYFSLSTYDDLNGLIYSKINGKDIIPDTNSINPYIPGANISTQLQHRVFRFVVLEKNTIPFDPDPIYLKNQLYWAHSERTGELVTTSIDIRNYNSFVDFPFGLPGSKIKYPLITKIVVHNQVVQNPQNYYNSLLTQVFRAFLSPIFKVQLFLYGEILSPNRNAYSNPWESPLAQIKPPVDVDPAQILWYRWVSRAVPLSDQQVNSKCGGYLISTLPRTGFNFGGDSVAITRMKLPTCFDINNIVDDLYPPNLQTAYTSISVYSYESTSDYTVNCNNLQRVIDQDGFVIIFLLPVYIRDALQREQGLKPTEGAPVYRWGRYLGLVLPYPRYSLPLLINYPNLPGLLPLPVMVLREKQQSSDFAVNGGVEGSLPCPLHIPLQAATGPFEYNNWQASGKNSNMGDYAPVTFGDSYFHFTQGNIGPVFKDAPFPIV